MQNKKDLSTTVKSFIFGLGIILALMILSYVLTFIIPAGEYKRIIDANGNSVIDTTINSLGEYSEIDKSFPFYKFLLSPILVFTIDGGTTILAIIIFLIVIGGIFEVLNECGVMEYLLKKIVNRFYKSRYHLMAIVILFFMLLGSLVGSFEEVIPMVPFMVALTVSLGFDAVTGILISYIAVGCGFSCGIMNPFTVGVAQKLIGLKIFSGAWLRIVSFVIIYIILVTFTLQRARKIENKDVEHIDLNFVPDPKLDKAVKVMGIIIGTMIIIIISSAWLTFLQDYTLILTGLAFLISGISASIIVKVPLKEFFKNFGKGFINIASSIILIMMASSIKYILSESGRIDTLVKFLLEVTNNLPRWSIILIVYFIVLLMEFFISSGSAKAFLLIPLLCPVASVLNIPYNLIVLAYIFGDGFSNMLYPTNAGLLVTLSISEVGFKEYVKKLVPLFIMIFVTTVIVLLVGLAVGYC